MTLARKIFLMMEIGHLYTASRLAEMLKAEYERVYNELVDAGDMDTYLNEEWMQACETDPATLRVRVREALAVTRKFGYTKVEVESYDPYFIETHHCGKGYGKTIKYYHDGGKRFYYIRIRK